VRRITLAALAGAGALTALCAAIAPHWLWLLPLFTCALFAAAWLGARSQVRRLGG
jgi:hypothetical protein